MSKFNLSDTIAAISTGLGESGIGIVRLSGRDALKIADKVFKSKDGKAPSQFKTYTTHYGWIVDQRANIIDEVLLTVMRAPKSYTREDVVEVNCHGGMVAMRRVLDLVLENGARLAEPGEFTQRAFLKGRIDLVQAEAVLEIIRAKTDAALKISTAQLQGALSSQINNFRKALLEIVAILEANIDFPEEEIGTVNLKKISQKMRAVHKGLKNIIGGYRRGRILREGIQVVICGKPNVGKSSLLNALLKEERSIVTPVAGTTRDTIEEIIDIQGIPVRIVDTAGMIEPRDLLEKKAVTRSRQQVALADLVILLFDGSKKIDQDDQLLIRKLKHKPVIAVVNKIDLKEKIEREKLLANFGQVIGISAKKIKNISLLEDALAEAVFQGKVTPREAVLVSNLRHLHKLKEAQKLIEEALVSLDNKLSLEFMAQSLKDALGSLDDILGKRFSEDLLEKIFQEFCIGK